VSAGPDLDHLLARARQAEVRPELAVAAVAAAARAAHAPAVAHRPWWPRIAAGAGLALALAAVVLLAWPRRAAPPAAVVAIGDRVAIAVSPGGRYAVAAADDERTVVVVERGAVTARLWPGARPHRLALRGADVEATATGTVFTVAVDDRGATVRVHEGTVQVIAADGAHAVAAGAWWPDGPGGRALGAVAATQLLALPAPRALAPDATARDSTTPIARAPDAAGPEATASDAAAPSPPPPPAADAAVAAAAPRDPAAVTPPIDAAADAPTAPVPLVERWRRARLLRAQGHADAALSACLDIAAAGDPTWSPIALVEAIRIELDARAAPEAALARADQMLARWPAHALIADTRALRCRALRQLGRGAECAPPP